MSPLKTSCGPPVLYPALAGWNVAAEMGADKSTKPKAPLIEEHLLGVFERIDGDLCPIETQNTMG